MINDACARISQDIIRLIADTFDMDSDRVTLTTRPDDIDGWDSLGHSVLLGRLERRLSLKINEEVAAPITTVGELVERFSSREGAQANG